MPGKGDVQMPSTVRSAKKHKSGSGVLSSPVAPPADAAQTQPVLATAPAAVPSAPIVTPAPPAAAAAVAAVNATASPLKPSRVHEWSFGEWFDDLLQRNEPYIPVALLLICAATRFYRLDQPNGVVFDETHFGRFTQQYHAHTYLFDMYVQSCLVSPHSTQPPCLNRQSFVQPPATRQARVLLRRSVHRLRLPQVQLRQHRGRLRRG